LEVAAIGARLGLSAGDVERHLTHAMRGLAWDLLGIAALLEGKRVALRILDFEGSLALRAMALGLRPMGGHL
jgi:hypothetical protein